MCTAPAAVKNRVADRGFVNIRPFRAMHASIFLLLVGLPTIGAVCTVCGGFFSGCTGGTRGRECAGPAAGTANTAALAAGSATAVTLVGMFKSAVTHVFNSPVVGLKTFVAFYGPSLPFDVVFLVALFVFGGTATGFVVPSSVGSSHTV